MRGWLLLFLLALAVTVGIGKGYADAKPVAAHHLKGAGNHIQSIHYSGSGWKEKWCTDVHFSTYSLADALTVINAAYTGGGTSDWHGLASYKVDLSEALLGQCFDVQGWQ
ncbi:MAG TPA: hypothetical protein VNM91_06640, partial [Dehalococcoidia bacterium]|nr:hypothetical protein [Dehalococcoidia bacterium]